MLLALVSVWQLPVWASNRSLWSHAVHVAPQSARAWMNLTAAEMEVGHCAEAWTAFAPASALATNLTECGVLSKQRDWLSVFCPVQPLPPSRCWP